MVENNSKQNSFLWIISVIGLFFIMPTISFARTPLEVSGWVPYWREATGTIDAVQHITSFTEISPFGFGVKKDGTLLDLMNIATSTYWQNLIQAARTHTVKVIPTVMWSDTDAIDTVLRSSTLRKTHEQAIIAMLNAGNYDGVDIDYEGKSDTTKNYFSLFLKELWNMTGKRLVVCSIEPRTPLDSRYTTIPQNITYANDLVAINKYCDRVRIMTYDQGRIDLKLNKTAIGPYNPIADIQWVQKVVNLMAKDISKKKIELGVATYGHEYELTPDGKGGFTYDFLTSFDPLYAIGIAESFNYFPIRDEAGELNFSYMPTTTPYSLERYFSWSDSKAIQDKMVLAKKLGLRGIAIFKIDGGEDPLMWDVIQKYK